jgi:hypothetical protein
VVLHAGMACDHDPCCRATRAFVSLATDILLAAHAPPSLNLSNVDIIFTYTMSIITSSVTVPQGIRRL